MEIQINIKECLMKILKEEEVIEKNDCLNILSIYAIFF
jgi:hypothetical protein